ncbi:hypothetical protein Nwat_2250 [Nitrosococcus watsonii C-113]|uniref:Uncharacterized protein n=1 Tax=Nitrosococcus watsoni (strain C-113) TaxID=105559 RepID=D8K8F9_NITWC|nr:hypothetical protein Nwat_2250 [Nitrosococcus watsonii C-113]
MGGERVVVLQIRFFSPKKGFDAHPLWRAPGSIFRMSRFAKSESVRGFPYPLPPTTPSLILQDFCQEAKREKLLSMGKAGVACCNVG